MSERRDKPTRVGIFLFAAVIVAVMAATAGGATGAAASAAAKPKWLTILGLWDGVSGPSVVGSASGRGWIALGAEPMTLGSLRRAGGRLSFAKATLPATAPTAMVGSELMYHPIESGPSGKATLAPLLANGKVGSRRAVPGDPESIPPQRRHPVLAAGIQAGGRSVWLLTGHTPTESGGIARSYVWACCSTTGELSDLTPWIAQRPLMSWQLALDSKKRLWLAWLQRSREAVVGSVKLLELDAETLAPRTPTATTLPGGRTATGFVLSCAAFCRVVMTDLLSGDLLASSPGQRSPTRMASGTRENGANVLAATDHSGRLAAAYVTSRSPDPAKAQVHEIEVVVGDARGSHPRRLGVIDLPDSVGPSFDLYLNAYATFVPGGLVYFAFYYPGGAKTRVLGGFLPLAG